jgi:hypothetical protein
MPASAARRAARLAADNKAQYEIASQTSPPPQQRTAAPVHGKQSQGSVKSSQTRKAAQYAHGKQSTSDSADPQTQNAVPQPPPGYKWGEQPAQPGSQSFRKSQPKERATIQQGGITYTVAQHGCSNVEVSKAAGKAFTQVFNQMGMSNGQQYDKSAIKQFTQNVQTTADRIIQSMRRRNSRRVRKPNTGTVAESQ